jgi:uncharacterized repeat protein (TIGR02543 family)
VRGDKAAFSHYTTKTAWVFAGWYSDSALTAYYNRSSPVTANITLYAKWVPGSYTITIEKNGGIWEGGGEDKYYYTTGDPAIVLPTTIVRVGYSFQGWYYNAALSSKVPDTGVVPTGNITLYAKWKTEQTQFEVAFVVVEVLGWKKVLFIIPYAGKVPKPKDGGGFPNAWTYPTYTGIPTNRFNGWYEERNTVTGGGKGRKWVFGTDRVYKAMTLYAGWHSDANPSNAYKPMPGWND